MPIINLTSSSGEKKVIEAEYGRSLMEIIRDAGEPDMLAICGGCCSCATCHVYIDPEFLEKIDGFSDDENDLLDSSDCRKDVSRLACQIKFGPELNGIKVELVSEV